MDIEKSHMTNSFHLLDKLFENFQKIVIFIFMIVKLELAKKVNFQYF